jgi:hypothetical protein
VPKRALPGLVEIERVHVEARLAAKIRARHQHVHFQEFVTQVFSKAAHAIAPVALHDRDLVAFDFQGHIDGRCCGGRQRHGWRGVLSRRWLFCFNRYSEDRLFTLFRLCGLLFGECW